MMEAELKMDSLPTSVYLGRGIFGGNPGPLLFLGRDLFVPPKREGDGPEHRKTSERERKGEKKV